MTAADRDTLRIFAGSGGKQLAESMAQHLNLRVSAGSADRFPDGEVIVRVQEDVRGRDCFVVQSTCEPVNDRLVELLVWIDCLRRASARRITAVIPYFGYARQDRKDEGRVPITAKLVANMLTEAGADRVLCLDLHAAQIQGFFDIPVDHVTAVPIFPQPVRKGSRRTWRSHVGVSRCWQRQDRQSLRRCSGSRFGHCRQASSKWRKSGQPEPDR